MLLLAFIALFLAPFAIASASDQFKLKTQEDASQCFLTCHTQVINTVNLPGQPSNSAYAYGANCRLDDWRRLMAQCLTITCESPPDVAYAIEYTSSICGRAGVDVILELPISYLDTTDGAYFNSSLYLESNDGHKIAISYALGTAVAIGTQFTIEAIGAVLV